MAIPQNFLDDLLERVDIVDVVGRYVTLKKGGANLLGLCPFHDEKSPSFTVSPSKQFYHCFGCGKHGNAIGFLMDYTGVGFVDAVHDLAQQAGMQVPQEDISPAQAVERQQRKAEQQTLSGINDRAAKAYKQLLRQAPQTIQYLKGRGVSGEIAARFQLGYAPPGEHSLAAVFPDYADPLLETAGLVIYKSETNQRYDRFRDRLMFPIRNVRGECIGFGGRILGQGQPKYLNSPETPIFHKGRELYGLFEGKQAIRQMGYALVCEGYMDVVALAQWGFANAVATLGTASSEQHVQLLLRHTDSVVFAFDGDNAGRKAATKALLCALPFATDTRSIRFLFLPKEHDPDSFIRERGQPAFAEQIELALPLSQYLLQVAGQDCNLATPEGRARMAHQARPLWAALPEGGLKLQIRAEVARIAQMDSADLQQLWQQAGAAQGASPRRSQPHATSSAAPGMPGMPAAPDAPEAYAPFDAYEHPDYPPPADAHGETGAPWPPYEYEAPSQSHQPNGPQTSSRASSWSPAGHGTGRNWRNNKANQGGRGGTPTGPLRQRPLRSEEHAACILLAHMGLLETLSEQDLALLCRLPQPDGTLFAWVDDHYQHHGVQDWETLKPLLLTTRQGAIERLLARIEDIARQPADNYRSEFTSVLRQIMKKQLAWEIEQATRAYETDSQAGVRLRQLTSHLATLK
ncbi:DNA primase [Corticibacter populi]|uniref:DNA primase n=1 Tax=Corticibacter populi TaxID=1550736 RepID=A0A3M6QLK4_9BURK|nr:DNA primase [Corticibacter populi]RMX03611.1 DNA primase [Corticibacter populi]RZS30069.1 DNA primase [Corticibacter populi]